MKTKSEPADMLADMLADTQVERHGASALSGKQILNLGAHIVARLANPDRGVVLVCGDGAEGSA